MHGPVPRPYGCLGKPIPPRVCCSNFEPNVYSYTALMAIPRNVGEATAQELLKQASHDWKRLPP